MFWLKEEENKIIVKLDENSKISDYQVKMIKYNEIENLLNFNISMDIENTSITYDLENLITLNEFIKENAKVNDVDTIIRKIEKIFLNLEDYLLKIENIFMEIDKIYVDKLSYAKNNEIELYFLYAPLVEEINTNNQSKYEDLKLEIRNIKREEVKTEETKIEKNKQDEKDKETGELLEKFINKYDEIEKMAEEEKYEERIKILKYAKKISIVIIVIMMIMFRNSMTKTIITFFAGAAIYLLFESLIRVAEIIQMNETMEDDKTLLIKKYPYLRKSILDEKIYVTTDNFIIGKSDSSNLVLNSNSISKSHASISKKEFGYYVKDLGSTNFTFVNENKLDENEERLLVSGDKIKFADETFQFIYEA